MLRRQLLHADLTESVIGAFYEVHRELGFGFLEHFYVMALERELRARGHRVAREIGVQVRYKGETLGTQRLDMLVDDALVVEVKASEKLHGMATRQVFNYLRATELELGLVLHFGPEPAFHRVYCRRRGAAVTGFSESSAHTSRPSPSRSVGHSDKRMRTDAPEDPDPPEGPRCAGV